jgi:hypothetical protein
MEQMTKVNKTVSPQVQAILRRSIVNFLERRYPTVTKQWLEQPEHDKALRDAIQEIGNRLPDELRLGRSLLLESRLWSGYSGLVTAYALTFAQSCGLAG